jgi:hypothetical protein
MTFAHSLQKGRLVTAEMNELWIRDHRKDIEEFVPYALFSVLVVGPKAILNSIIAGSDAGADQIVRVAIRQTFDIQIDGRAVEFRVREIDDVYLVFADRERPQRMMKFFLLASQFAAASTRTKCVGQLGNREDALAV